MFVCCHFLQCYVFCTVLNSVTRLLVRSSTQSLCRFIHRVSCSTRMVISTLFAAQCLISLRIQRLSSPITYNLPTIPRQFFIPSYIFLFCMLLHMCIRVFLCIHIVHYIRGRQIDRLSVHCDLHTNNFCTNNSAVWLQHPIMSYSRGKAMQQVYSKHCLHYYQNSGKHQHTSLCTLQFYLWKQMFKKKFFFLFFPERDSFNSAFLPFAQVIFATTY